MIRFVEAFKAAVADDTNAEVILEFINSDLEAMVGPQGRYQPMTGDLSKSVGTIDKIMKMVCRRKLAPDLDPELIFKSTNGLTMTQFNAMFAHDTSLIPTLPKLPVLGGYEVVLTLDTSGGTGDVSWMTKGENSLGVSDLPSGLPVSITGDSTPPGVFGPAASAPAAIGALNRPNAFPFEGQRFSPRRPF